LKKVLRYLKGTIFMSMTLGAVARTTHSNLHALLTRIGAMTTRLGVQCRGFSLH
jgi:hypothetical protein